MKDFIANQRPVLIPVFLAITVLAATWVNSVDKRIVNAQAPKGIFSLEMAWTGQKANAIREAWRNEQVHQHTTQADHDAKRDYTTKDQLAKESIFRDYPFIICYCLTLALFVYIRNPDRKGYIRLRFIANPNQWRKFFLSAIPVIAALDFVENIGMTLFLMGSKIPPWIFSVPASAKFVLLLSVAVHLINFADLSHLMKTFRTYFFGVASVVMVYWLLIKLTPGQDVVIVTGERLVVFLLTMFTILLWSFYSWYSARLIGYVKEMGNSLIPHGFHRHTPRLISFNCMVSIQAAIFALPTIAGLSEAELWSFLLIQNMLYFLFSDMLNSKEHRRAYAIIMIICLASYIAAVVFLVVKAEERHQYTLPPVALALFILQFGVVFGLQRRRARIDKNRSVATGAEPMKPFLVILNKVVIAIPESMYNQEKRAFKVFNIIAGIGFALYVASFWLSMAHKMGPLAAVVISLAIIVGIANFISVISIRSRVNMFFYLLVVAIIIGRWFDPYEVRVVESTNQHAYAKRIELLEYFKRWYKDPARVALIKEYADQKKQFPVYLVISDGGASRSGYWVASMLSYIQDTTLATNPHDPFSEHLLAIGGASGGSVGNATFFSLLRGPSSTQTYLDRSQKFLANDFLSPIVMSWFGTDVLQHMLPLHLPDRAAMLELAMERADDRKSYGFKSSFSDMIDTTGRLPILFLNVTNLQRGAPAVISTVQLDGFSLRLDVLDSVEKLDSKMNYEIKYSTAVVLGSRFPYVSPAGTIGNHDYVDGGYFDNTGAGIIHEMLQTLDTYRRSLKTNDPDSTILSSLSFRLIYLSNSSNKNSASKSVHPVLNDAAAPVLTVLGTYSSQTEVNNSRLINFINRLDTVKRPADDKLYIEFNLYRKRDSIDYPMNWVISDFNRGRMNKRVKELKDSADFKFVIRNLNQ